MYLKDKNNRITLRLSDDQFYYVLQLAHSFNVSPSEMIRILIRSSQSKGGTLNENVKAYNNSIV